MGIIEKLDQDIIAAMKAREEHRLTTLRMVKSAIKNKQIEKRAPLEEQEAIAVLSTLIKQRKDSIEQFTKGGRTELADKEAAEIKMIEGYMPAAAGEAEVLAAIRGFLAEMGAPTIKDMGAVMKRVMAHFQEKNVRVEGKLVSDLVKRELSAGK